MNYETLIITFAESIRALDDFFDDPEVWGVASLKEWVDNMTSVREWLEYYMPIANIEEM